MLKIGNSHSSLLNALSASKKEPTAPAFDLTAILKSAAKKEPTLKEILAQFNLPDDSMESAPPSASTDTSLTPQTENTEPDTEGAKSNLCQALIALCGGVEEAKACLDAASSPQPGETGEMPAPAPDTTPAPPQPMLM